MLMKKRLVFESVFVLLLILLSLYLVSSAILIPNIGAGEQVVLRPNNNSNTTQGDGYTNQRINFTCNYSTAGVWGAGLVQNMSLWANFNGSFSYNLSNASEVVGNKSMGFELSNLSDGTYLWGCFIGLANASTIKTVNYTYTMDTVAPSITLNTANATWFSNASVSVWNLRFTATDTTLNNCTLYHDMDKSHGFLAINETIANVTSGTSAIFNFTNLGWQGNASGFNYFVRCTDNANRSTDTTNYSTFFIDGWNPNVTITTTNSSGLTA